MAKNYLTPGVYVEEISTLTGIVAEVQSAVPAFIGFTEQIRYDGRSLLGVPEPIESFKDFEARFGKAAPVFFDAIAVKTNGDGSFAEVSSITLKKRFLLYEALYMYFANGGSRCYVVSIGSFTDATVKQDDPRPHLDAIEALNMVDDVTLLVMPEAVFLGEGLPGVQQRALTHCAERKNRFAVLDILESAKSGKSVLLDWTNAPDPDPWKKSCQTFRDTIGINNLSYGAVYTPYITADAPVSISYQDIRSALINARKPVTNTVDGQEPARLGLSTLDPSVKEAVGALDAALEDQSNLAAAVTAARAFLTSGNVVGTDTSPARLAEAIKAYNATWSDASIKATGTLLANLFASLTGLDSNQESPAPFAGKPLSDDLRQHARDQLLRLTTAIAGWAKPAALSAHSSDMPLLDKLGTAVATLDPAHLDDMVEAVDKLLAGDLYYSIASNVNRLSDGLLSTSAVFRSLYNAARSCLRLQPPSAAMAGVYAAVDNARGVWKAPANVNLGGCLGLTQNITAQEQESLNSDSVGGKSINVIRAFPGKGYLVWGARTLDGNSQEWRYIPVRRFFLMVEESVRRATSGLVFEPNDAILWSKVKAMIDNYLLQKWKDGALMGASPAEAFMVNVGLGSTMTEEDIQEGRLIVDIGMAVVRPAEFIILRFMHKMQQN